MKKFFTLMAAMLMLSASAETLTLYGETGEYLAAVPFNGNWVDEVGNKTQVLYPAADLTEMVGKQITAITFYSEPEGNALEGGLLDISLGETTESVMSAAYITEGMTKVGTCTFTACPGEVYEMTITFDTPYTYNGGNLVFENVVVESTSTSFTYWTGMKTNYNNAVVGSFGGPSTRQFLPKTTFTYGEGGGEEEGLTLLADANALEDNSEFTFDGDAVVTLYKSGYLFLRDESGYGMIPEVSGEFENGQVLSKGWSATKTSVNGWNRFINAEGLSASGETNAELAAPIEPTSIDESMINAYVCYKNVEFNMFGRKIKLENGTTIPVYDLFGVNMPAGMGETTHYNCYGVVINQNGTLKVCPAKWEDYEPEPEFLRGDVNNDGLVNIADVTALIDYLLSGDATGVNLEAANCNLDEGINIADVTALVDYLLNQSWPE